MKIEKFKLYFPSGKASDSNLDEAIRWINKNNINVVSITERVSTVTSVIYVWYKEAKDEG